jgi:hypothetical protein
MTHHATDRPSGATASGGRGMSRWKRVTALVAAGSMWLGLVGPAAGADNGTVDAQVTVASPCIEITTPATGTIDFGTLPFSSASDDSLGQDYVTYVNCSGSDEHIWGEGTSASGTTATWDLNDYLYGLNCDQGLNQYKLAISGTSVFTNLATTAKDLQTLASAADSGLLHLDLTMPCVGSDGVSDTMSFQVIFTATF